jgi:hypothetical protein
VTDGIAVPDAERTTTGGLAAHGADGDAQGLGNLVVGQVAEIAQDKHRPLSSRQRS